MGSPSGSECDISIGSFCGAVSGIFVRSSCVATGEEGAEACVGVDERFKGSFCGVIGGASVGPFCVSIGGMLAGPSYSSTRIVGLILRRKRASSRGDWL